MSLCPCRTNRCSVRGCPATFFYKSLSVSHSKLISKSNVCALIRAEMIGCQRAPRKVQISRHVWFPNKQVSGDVIGVKWPEPAHPECPGAAGRNANMGFGMLLSICRRGFGFSPRGDVGGFEHCTGCWNSTKARNLFVSGVYEEQCDRVRKSNRILS